MNRSNFILVLVSFAGVALLSGGGGGASLLVSLGSVESLTSVECDGDRSMIQMPTRMAFRTRARVKQSLQAMRRLRGGNVFYPNERQEDPKLAWLLKKLNYTRKPRWTDNICREEELPLTSPYYRQHKALLSCFELPCERYDTMREKDPRPCYTRHVSRFIESVGVPASQVNESIFLPIRYLEREGKFWIDKRDIKGEDTFVFIRIDDRLVKFQPDVWWDERWGPCTLIMVDIDNPDGHFEPPPPEDKKVETKDVRWPLQNVPDYEAIARAENNNKALIEDNGEEKGPFSSEIRPNSPMMHWMVTDAYQNSSSGRLIYRYNGPKPDMDGTHRYCFMVFKQNEGQPINAPLNEDGSPGKWSKERMRWPLKRFLAANPHLELKAVNYYLYDHTEVAMAMYNKMLGETAHPDWEPKDADSLPPISHKEELEAKSSDSPDEKYEVPAHLWKTPPFINEMHEMLDKEPENFYGKNGESGFWKLKTDQDLDEWQEKNGMGPDFWQDIADRQKGWGAGGAKDDQKDENALLNEALERFGPK